MKAQFMTHTYTDYSATFTVYAMKRSVVWITLRVLPWPVSQNMLSSVTNILFMITLWTFQGITRTVNHWISPVRLSSQHLLWYSVTWLPDKKRSKIPEGMHKGCVCGDGIPASWLTDSVVSSTATIILSLPSPGTSHCRILESRHLFTKRPPKEMSSDQLALSRKQCSLVKELTATVYWGST
jgi:hypothetical protein